MALGDEWSVWQTAKQWMDGSFADISDQIPAAILEDLDVAVQLCKPPPALSAEVDDGFVPLALRTSTQVGFLFSLIHTD